jgi:hypothetical protein
MGKVPFLAELDNLTNQQFAYAENPTIYDAAEARVWAVSNNSFPQIVPVRENFKDNAMGDGAEFSHRKEIISQTNTFAPQFRCAPEVAAYWFALAMGSVTTVGTGVDYANRYQHTLKVQTGRSLPLFHFVGADGRDDSVSGPVPKIYRNNVVTGIKISGASPGSNPILIEPTILGSGEFTDTAGGYDFGSPDRPRPNRMSDIEFLISTTPYEADFDANGTPWHARLKNWEIEFQNGGGETQVPGAGSVYQNLFEHGGERTAFLRVNFTKDIDADSGQDAVNVFDQYLLATGSAFAFRVKLTGVDDAATGATTARILTFTVPEAQLNAPVTEGDDGTNMTWDMEFECTVNPDISGYSAGFGDLFNLLVDGGINNDFFADYAAAP